MNSNNIQTPETQKNFEDFDNMFKEMDRPDLCLAAETAKKLLEKVELENDKSRLDDITRWLDKHQYWNIRCDEKDIYYGSDSDGEWTFEDFENKWREPGETSDESEDESEEEDSDESEDEGSDEFRDESESEEEELEHSESERLKNYEDFDIMYKKADRPHRLPIAAAWIVRYIVRDTEDRARTSDVHEWFNSRYFHKKDRQVSTDSGKGFKLTTDERGKAIGSITDDESDGETEYCYEY